MTTKEIFIQAFNQFKCNNRLTLTAYNMVLSALDELDSLHHAYNELNSQNEEVIEEYNELKEALKGIDNKNSLLIKEKYKLKKAIESLKDSLCLEIDLDHYNLYTSLGTIAFVNVNKEIAEDLELLKDIIEKC